ncbi:MAG: hypothetical protein JKY19_10975 [Alcanivoracaceae bacterium]|nr:hypothetical protein [Alcanivoracaceae bacterium]
MQKHLMLLMLLLSLSHAWAQDSTTIIAGASTADGLDLMAVSELFKETDNLQEFEKTLNDPELGVNNLDLDGNGEVDFIRVVEEVAQYTHIIILQATIGKDEFQDVATIEVEKAGDNYNMQIRGNEIVYGANYYIVPSYIHVHTWPIIAWIYRPVYRPYRSTFYFGFYPRWWRPYHPVHFKVYRTRTVKWTRRNTFVVVRSSRVKTVSRVKYKPRTSVRASRSITVRRTGGKTTTTKKAVKKTTNKKTGKTTVKKGVKKTTKNKNAKKTTVKKGKKKTVKKKN